MQIKLGFSKELTEQKNMQGIRFVKCKILRFNLTHFSMWFIFKEMQGVTATMYVLNWFRQ
jgi:hypothetical protein